MQTVQIGGRVLTGADVDHIVNSGERLHVWTNVEDIPPSFFDGVYVTGWLLKVLKDETAPGMPRWLCITQPSTPRTRKILRNGYAKRVATISQRDIRWGRDYVKHAKGVMFAAEDGVIALVSRLYTELSVNEFFELCAQRALRQACEAAGHTTGVSEYRLHSTFEILGKFLAAPAETA